VTAADARALGWDVPADVPDCAELVHDGFDVGDVSTEGTALRFAMTARNAFWSWVSLKIGIAKADGG